MPDSTPLGTLYAQTRGVVPLHQQPDYWNGLTPGQAGGLQDLLLQVARDLNTLTDPAALVGLEPQQILASLQLLMSFLRDDTYEEVDLPAR